MINKIQPVRFLSRSRTSMSLSNTVISTNSNSVTVSTVDMGKSKVSLHKYLLNEENYTKFTEYLTTCFALENLLYMVKVVAFRHVLMDIIYKQRKQMEHTDIKTENEEYSNSKQNDEWCQVGMKSLFAIRFDYIDGLYQNCTPNDKLTVHEIAKDIYNRFIISNALYEINLSYETRQALNEFFNSGEENKTIEEYLVVFNESIYEVYTLLKSVYLFQFKNK